MDLVREPVTTALQVSADAIGHQRVQLAQIHEAQVSCRRAYG